MLTLAQHPVWAQTIPPGGNLINVPAPNGAVWTLQGDAILSDGVNASAAKALPVGTPGLTINGVAAGSTITLNDGAGHFGFFSGSTATVNVSNVILTGGSETFGGAFNLTGDLIINNSGTVAFTQNTVTGDGGAIFTDGSVTLGSGGGAVMLTNNHADIFGGAVRVLTDFSLTAGADSTISGNTANGGEGGALWVSRNIALNALGGDITFSGNLVNASLTPLANAIFLRGAGFAGGGPATAVFNAAGDRTITFFDPVQTGLSNNPVEIDVTGSGAVVFDGSLYSNPADQWSKVFGHTAVEAGTTMVVDNNAVYGFDRQQAIDVLAPVFGRLGAALLLGNAASSYKLNAGGTLMGGVAGTIIADQIAVNGNLDIAGAVPGQRGVFNLNSNNISFGPGSQVLFNTLLNDGVVQDTDLLVLNLNGTATSGQASILVNNVGGLGALTVGDGIKLVQTNNGTTAGAFVLGNRVAAGAFEYDLFYGGNPATGGNPDDQNWYLRSEAVPRPEVPTVTVLPALANRLGLRLLGTYHERYGGEFPVLDCGASARVDRITPVADVVSPCVEERRMAMWGRVFGETGETDFGGSVDDFRDHGPGYDFDMEGLQAGLDILNVRHEDNTRDFAGLSVGFASSSADVNDATGDFAGTSDLDVYSLGGYWTHFGAAGWYVDAVLQGLLYDNGEAKSSAGENFDTDGWGMTASLEAGYPFALGDAWTLEPQAQLIYQHVSLSDGEDQFGQISLDDTDVAYGRLGGRLVRYWATTNDLRVSTWLLANVWSDFGEQAKTTFATFAGDFATSFDTDLGGTWGSVGLGLTGQVSDNMQLFASGEYNTGLDDGDFWSVSGRAGLKIVW